MIKRVLSVLMFLVLLVALTSCDDPNSLTFSPMLEVLPSSMSLYEDDYSEKINLSNLVITNLDTESLVFSIITLPQHGNVNLYKTKDGIEVYYTPDNNFYGEDSFIYQVTNGKITAQNRINIRVRLVNDIPSLLNIRLTAYENTSLVINLENYVFDIDSDHLIYTLSLLPDYGFVSLNGSILTYSPSEGFIGNVTIGYMVQDEHNGVNSGYIHITVVPKPSYLEE